MKRISPRCRQTGWVLVIVLGAFVAATVVSPRAASTTEVSPPPDRGTILAGDERAIPVLQEIAATLKQIDARLSRLEKAIPAPREP